MSRKIPKPRRPRPEVAQIIIFGWTFRCLRREPSQCMTLWTLKRKSVQDARRAGRKLIRIIVKLKCVKNCLVSGKNTPKTMLIWTTSPRHFISRCLYYSKSTPTFEGNHPPQESGQESHQITRILAKVGGDLPRHLFETPSTNRHRNL